MSDDLDAIEDRLRQQGDRKREMTVVDRILGIGVDVDDLRKRRDRQGRRKQVAAMVTLAAALVLSAGAVAATVVVPRATEPLAAPPASTAEATPPTSSGGSGGTRAYRPPSTTPGTTPRAAEEPLPSTPGTTPPASPTTTDEPAPGTRGRGIRDIDVAAVAEREADCGDRRNGRGRPVVSHVDYGNVVGDGSDDALVTLACPGDRSTVRAALYSLSPTSASGVRRVAGVEPDPATRALLLAQAITGWTLRGVALAGSTVESQWVAVRALGPVGGPHRTFTLRQRWTGGGWMRLGPLQVSPASR